MTIEVAMRAAILIVAVTAGQVATASDSAEVTRIPFVKGLTTVRVATSPVGDYETLRTVEEISDKGYRIVTSGEAPADSGEGLIPVTVVRNVRAVDQLHSRNVRIAWHSSDRESISGNVPGVSCDLFNELRANGKAELTYVNVTALAGIATTKNRLKGIVSVVDRKPFSMLVNRKRVSLPALHVKGVLSDDEENEPFDFHVVDDADNPMMLRASINGSDARVMSIEFPPDTSSLERMLAATEVVELSGIYFTFASATLRPESDRVIAQLADVLKGHADWRFRIDGHTDAIGGDASNLDLSRRRSAAVRSALVDRYDVAAAQITTQGFGEALPKEANDTDAGRARNRRVELVRLNPVVANASKIAPPPRAAGSACKFGSP
jgi:outer membrane protein OmpA-like peptidoglycan-associated protein